MKIDFNTFKQIRYNTIPYDFKNNPYGFSSKGLSDISAHLPMLEFLASQCNHVTEFGTRDCFSTSALLSGCKNLVVSYDIRISPMITLLKTLEKPCEWKFIQADTGKDNFVIEPTELLFIDSLHTYNHVTKELRQAKLVSKYLIFHDTVSNGYQSLDKPKEQGILLAIQEFLNQNTEWKMVYDVKFNHGLMVLSK